ncbi:hypothetical protein ANO14919_050260 [Xylariales sp. No.14919]|nr:hypothetical protein ANO14919_050260 [Xylariales sp. No.14919]
MFTKLKGMCTSGSGCTSDHAEMENVETIIADGDEPLKPAMYLQHAQYSSAAALDRMLSAVAKDLSSRAVFAERPAGALARCSGKEEAWLESANSPSAASITAAIPSFATNTRHECVTRLMRLVDDGFPCEAAAGAITATMRILAPELTGADAFEGVELEAICGIIDDPTSVIGNW